MRTKLAGGRGGELLEHQLGVADDSDFDLAVVADFLAVDIDVDEFGVLVKARRQQKGEHRIGPRSDHQHHVGLAKRHRARRRKRPRMVLGYHSAALRRGPKRKPGGVDKAAQVLAGPRPQHAAAGNHNRTLRLLQKVNRALHHRRVARGA